MKRIAALTTIAGLAIVAPAQAHLPSDFTAKTAAVIRVQHEANKSFWTYDSAHPASPTVLKKSRKRHAKRVHVDFQKIQQRRGSVRRAFCSATMWVKVSGLTYSYRQSCHS